jgi:putative hydrolase of the HAD superfamily
MSLQAVFLDAGNTLFRPHPSVGSIYARVARRHGARTDPDRIEARFTAEWSRHDTGTRRSVKGEKARWKFLTRRVFDGLFRSEEDFAGFFDELHAEFAHPRTWRLFPDALPALKKLRKSGMTVGIVSNWDERLFDLCDGLRVTPWVDFVLASAVEGTAKPDREIFRRALKKAGVRPSEALHVGDSYREDYCGARRAGLSAVLLCRRAPAPEGARAIRSLRELPHFR